MDLQVRWLVATGVLHPEAVSTEKFAGLLRSRLARVTDAGKVTLALQSRFDLANHASRRCANAATTCCCWPGAAWS